MQICDEAIILSAYRLGESGCVLSTLTRSHGRLSGFLRRQGGNAQGIYQSGNNVRVTWNARLEDQLGSIRVEIERPIAAQFMHRPDVLLALQSVCAWCEMILPDRQPYPYLYDGIMQLFGNFGHADWLLPYALWEIDLLRHLGFGLDLSACAVTGKTDDLAYVSPKTGRAVSRSAAAPWADKLLPLPLFLCQFYANDNIPTADNDNIPLSDILSGLRLSGFFLSRHVLEIKRKSPPLSRQRLIEKVIRAMDASPIVNL